MRDVIGEALAATAVKGIGVARPSSSSPRDMESFQAVEAEADRLSSEGVIHLLEKHHESQTVNRCLDRIRFVRLR